MRNNLLEFATTKMSSEFAEALALRVTEVFDAGREHGSNRSALFFEVEPFRREFTEFDSARKLETADYDIHANWINRRLDELKQSRSKKPRPMFWSWLSYYHRADADALLDKFNADLPHYEGHPNLTECSEEAQPHFRRQDHSTIGHDEDAEPEVIQLPVEVPVENEPKGDKSNKRKMVLVGSLIALLLGSVAVTAAVNPAIFGMALGDDKTAAQPAPSNLAVSDDQGSPEQVRQNERLDNVGDVGSSKQADLRNETTSPESQVPRQSLSGEWDNYNWLEWATKSDAHFLPAVRRADFKTLQRAAETGNMEARLFMALAHDYGVFSEVNYRIALAEYLEPACREDNGWACTSIARHYLSSRGYRNDPYKALEYARKGCLGGNYLGCSLKLIEPLIETTTLITLDEDRPPRQKDRRAQKAACQSGNGNECQKLSIAYMLGDGVPRDIDVARSYWLIREDRSLPDFDTFFELDR